MKKITLNGKRYIGLGDFWHLRHNCVRDIYDSYEQDEDGKYHFSEFDMGQLAAYTHIMSAIMDDEIHSAESPDEIRAMHKDIQDEWLDGKYCIVTNDAETGERVYFRKMCGEDGDTPAFTTKKRNAMEFDSMFHASWMVDIIKRRVGDESGLDNLTYMPLKFEYMPPEELKSRLLNAIFGDDESGDESAAKLEEAEAVIEKGRKALDRAEALVKQIKDDAEPCEYHGDGTRAEDEDWADGIGQTFSPD